ncbi:hypothetical protein HHI36_012459 [Cryptolaemus montrouzieri]|uniref:CHK kinase-like domain-containing protein n=1 Tax=Cryptolaemus montrouzieri TaxID=559131 RepID=A0ABD2NEB0_9CUCU
MMSSATSSNELKNYLQQFLKEESIEEYDILMEGNSEKGGNYIGDVTFLTLVPKNGMIPYNLVIKTAKKSPKLRNAMPIATAYKREFYMYNQMFPELRKYIDSTKSEVELNYVPKILWLSNEDLHETFIMENLTHKGYKSWNKTKPMDINHIRLVMNTLGKHHALSLAMNYANPEYFDKISRNLTNLWIEFSKFLDPDIFQGTLLRNVLKFLEEAERQDLVDKYKSIVENIKVLVTSETPEEDRLVICHGDCWNNNLLFKYEETDQSKPTDICLIDFQMSMLDTPVKDLSYFIYTACDKSTLNHVELFLKTYHASLKSCLTQLGSKKDDIFTYHQLKEHWKKYSSFGLLCSVFIVKAELSESDEAPDFVEICEQGNDPANAFNFKMRDENEYRRRMIEVFTHYAEQCL